MSVSMSPEGTFQRIKLVARRGALDVQALATLYAIERFVARLSMVDQESRTTIKGGHAFGIMFGIMTRPTKDLDLNIQVPDGVDPFEWVEALIRAAASQDLGDGLRIAHSDLTFERRPHQGAGGLRIGLTASIHTCRTPFVVDIGMNNEMSYEPTEVSYGGILSGEKNAPGPTNLRLYPLENTIAEKIISKIEDGAASIRHKDFFDLWLAYEIGKRLGDFNIMFKGPGSLSESERLITEAVRNGLVDGTVLSLPEQGLSENAFERIGYAFGRTAIFRRAEIPDSVSDFMRTEFANNPHQAAQWTNWCRNNRKRLLYVPPGTENLADKDRSFHVLFDALDPVFQSVNAVAPALAVKRQGFML